MRTIIAGSRDCRNLQALEIAIAKCGWQITTVISGTARGADRLGELWAERHNVTLERYPANWDTYGAQAGFLRNVQMADRAEALLALWDGASPGTAHMINCARQRNIPVFVFDFTTVPWTPHA